MFLVVIPMGLLSGTYFPITDPARATPSAVNPLHHLAHTYRGLLLGGPVGGHLATLALLSLLMVVVLVPLRP